MTEPEALLLSIAVEAPVAYVMVRARAMPGRGAWHAALAAAIATMATHPHLWALALLLYQRLGYWPGAIVAEVLVVAVEAVILAWSAGLSPRHALVASTAANGASVGVGLLLSG